MRRWRAVAVLAVGVAVGTSMVATPAWGHFQSSLSHLQSHFDPRYANAVKGTDKAKNADKLDGLNGSAFATSGESFVGSDFDSNTCDDSDLVSEEITISKPSRILASAQFRFIKDSPDVQQLGRLVIALMSGSSVVATASIDSPNQGVAVSEVGLTAVLNSEATNNPYVAQPGTYTLKQRVEIYQNCPFATHVRNARLTYVLLGSG